MRGIFVLLMLSFVLSACIINPARDRPVRSPTTFLRDVKIVVDSGDLGNVEFVGHQLRIVCDSDSPEPVRDREGTIKGYGVDVKCTASSKEYERERNFNYGLFWPNGMNFYRAGLSLPINGGAMCITPFDLLEVFGNVEKYPVSHWGSWSYVYKRSDINSRAVFSIDRNGCVGGVYVSMNRERVR
ncbi:hypothetical protein KDW19_11975 [Burkholderia cenocepacia]|uniref:hypothetical protein n=1 Tax=Burkholderia cepacia complex TaxID=87882 RepID=UPI000F5A33E1|nr:MULTISPECIES: hypothetical protein [Burkholderia cepacia complex]ELW9449958.1 hypothetical protein [Burkholderia cenocepacia]MBR7955448.1 hypothetical protein [Burkholderia cenocepacia]MBR8483172.1 hypothetical protein [Burkholderia cenocepacia]MDN7470917.1 hypothetical protein [Burkholderia orbicola]MDN7504040.1 hypothetical protein [Burkholderia orbicola]